MTQEPVQLAFFQTHLNQYGPPFFRYLERDARFRTSIIYTADPHPRIDPELNALPGWGAESLGDLRFELAHGLRGVVRAIAARRDFDLIFVDGWRNATAWAAIYAGWRFGARLAVRTDSTAYYREPRGLQWQVRGVILRAILSKACLIAYVSEGAREHMHLLGFDDGDLFRLPYTADISRFAQGAAASSPDRDDARRELGLTPEDQVLIAVAKLNDREGLPTLLDGFALALDRAPQLRLLLVGSGPLERMVATHRAASAIRAVGYRPYAELPSLYRLADVFVHAAPVEPWGISIVESMACGLPQVLSTGVGAGRELVRDGVNGYIFRAGDEVDLARCLLNWSTQPEFAKRQQGVEARLAISSFDYRHLADSLFDRAMSLRRAGKRE